MKSSYAHVTETISLGPKSPEAWFLPERPEDNRSEEITAKPNVHRSLDSQLDDLCNHGVSCWKVDSDLIASSMIASSGDGVANNSNQYADVIEISPEYFPQHSILFNGRRPSEILCYALIGSGGGFLDVCPDGSDKWIRIHVEKGDIISLPGDLFHRFSAPTTDNFADNCTPTSLVRIVLAQA